ncbi:MAG TPA: PIN domain nuclease [Solirubrobacteraceae bacterium]|jgi:predicted nucleic acid-binding protein|nr:PIN domain nuclease [Solirubrobacteraceae bacterium]
MALTHLLDTSVLTRLREPTVRETIEPLVEHGQLARAGISDLEIGFSARNATEWDRLADAVEAFELVETSAEHVRRAKQVQRLLASKHQRGRKLPDLLVAAAAEAGGLTVLHYDVDFDLIAAATGQPSEWVVPPGSVD